MDEPSRPPPPDRVVDSLNRGAREEALDRLEAVREAPTADRRATLRALRTLAEDEPAAVGGVGPALTRFLEDEERSVRLTTAKLFVALAEAAPDVVVPAVPSLADRLADEGEFYYVRARAAEALGYVALESPEDVGSPGILADLRVGLSVDEPEVKEKLAKALAFVALADPTRLRHQVSRLAEHLDDDAELVRYHLATALVAVGCAHPSALCDARGALADRLVDEAESPYVRGRAAEALGLWCRVDDAAVSTPARVETEDGDAAAFVDARVAFLRAGRGPAAAGERAEDAVGTLDSLREGTEAVVEAMTTPDGRTCPHCGLDLPEEGPPTCPRCGAPR